MDSEKYAGGILDRHARKYAQLLWLRTFTEKQVGEQLAAASYRPARVVQLVNLTRPNFERLQKLVKKFHRLQSQGSTNERVFALQELRRRLKQRYN